MTDLTPIIDDTTVGAETNSVVQNDKATYAFVEEIVAEKSLINDQGIALIVDSLLRQAQETESAVAQSHRAKKQTIRPGLRTGLRSGLSC